MGSSPAQKNKPIFKTRGKPLNGWSKADKNISKEYYDWCRSWSCDWFRVLKNGASCFVFAGRRYSHRCICALEDSGFIFKDMIIWQKDKAPHRAQGVEKVFQRRGDECSAIKWKGWKLGNLRPLCEPILWFVKPYPTGTTLVDNILKNEVGCYNEYTLKELSNNNLGIEICSNIIKTKTLKSDAGFHIAQKPLDLMKILISLTTLEDQVVLDPFAGSGTTLLAAKELNRQYIGIEKDMNSYNAAIRRLL